MASRRPKSIGVGGGGGLRTQPFGVSSTRKPTTTGGGRSLQLDKKLGQHLLKNPGVLEKIVAAGEIKSTDTVLEIGPGI